MIEIKEHQSLKYKDIMEKVPNNNADAKRLNAGANSKEGQSKFKKVKDYYEFVNVSELSIGEDDAVMKFKQWVDDYGIQQNLNKSQAS